MNKPTKVDLYEIFYTSPQEDLNTLQVYWKDDENYPLVYEYDAQLISLTRWGVWVRVVYYRPVDKTFWAVEYEKTNEATGSGLDWMDLTDDDIKQVIPVDKVIKDYNYVE